MPDRNASEAERLAAQRAKIDAVDETIHALLIQRAGVIDELIRIKGAAKTKGAAFRPGREAAMMEVLAARHKGSIPFSMIAHLWREIISTFTHMQADYGVHLALEGVSSAAIRDLARYQFGFTVPFAQHGSINDALAATRAESNAIAVIAAGSQDAWWRQLGSENGLMVMARLPIDDLPFDAPDCYCVAPPLSDPTPFDVRLYSGKANNIDVIDQWLEGMVHETANADDGSLHVMIGLKEGQKAPTDLLDIAAIGGYFAPVLPARKD